MGDGERELRGIGGWLAFFLVVLGLFSPARVIVTTWTNLYDDPQLAAAYRPVWETLETAEWAIAAVTVAGCWFVVWRLIAVRNRTSVRIAIAGLWVLALGMTFAELLAVSWIAGIPFELLGAGMALEIGRPVLFCLVWTGYLLRSVRVANTYGRAGGAEKVAGVFN